MSFLRVHIASKLTALGVVLMLLMPLALKFIHIFENHKHEVCLSKEAKHLHEVDHDCEFHKFKLNNPLSLLYLPEDSLEIQDVKMESDNHYTFLSEFQSLHFKLRGPPQWI